LCAALLLAVAACSKNAEPPNATSGPVAGPTANIAPRVRYDGPLPALPPPQYQLPRPGEVVHAVYEFAARRPDVLQYVPCFCGCQASGHVGNDDCFVASRDAAGKPTWDLHGMG
jgi:hypothetical protein